MSKQPDIAVGDWEALDDLAEEYSGDRICRRYLRDILPHHPNISSLVAWTNEAPGEAVFGSGGIGGWTRAHNLRAFAFSLDVPGHLNHFHDPERYNNTPISQAELQDFIVRVRELLAEAQS